MRSSSILTMFAAAVAVSLAIIPGGAAAATAGDPPNDNCMTGFGTACGIDFRTAGANMTANGTLHFNVTFTGTECVNDFFGTSTVTRPFFIIFPAGTSKPAQAAERGNVWAVSTTSQYLWTPAGTATDTNLVSAITPTSVDVTVPAAIASTFGGTFTWMVTNACRSHPQDPIYSDGDIAPDTGLYTFTADLCPNLAGTQFVVPAGMVRAAGVCVGTPAANRITGTAGADTIDSGAGNDSVSGGAGNDTLRGGAGKDIVSGGAGKDRVFGGAGNDTVSGDAGDDTVSGDAGNDTLRGAAGKDTLNGGAGKDKLAGGAGRDKLRGGAGNDTIDARDTSKSSGRDTISCGAGRDTVRANANDSVAGDCEVVRRVA